MLLRPSGLKYNPVFLSSQFHKASPTDYACPLRASDLWNDTAYVTSHLVASNSQ
ncbi:hypothetical protein J6590_056335, partial [Homalodisca vitripennis]